MKKSCRLFKDGLLILGLIASFISCGIDDYVVLEQVASSNVNVTLGNSQVTINLPSQSSPYFQNYEIYYRIYVSGALSPPAVIPPSLFSGINSALYTDYNAILSYTNPETSTPNNVATIFTSRGYYSLNIGDFKQGDGIPRSGGFRIDFALTDTITEPSLISGTPQPLRRSSALISPQPDRSFLNHADLSAYADLNKDVQLNSTGTGYTYVCMYIVASGVDPNISTINSKPTFIGVFPLP